MSMATLSILPPSTFTVAPHHHLCPPPISFPILLVQALLVPCCLELIHLATSPGHLSSILDPSQGAPRSLHGDGTSPHQIVKWGPLTYRELLWTWIGPTKR